MTEYIKREDAIKAIEWTWAGKAAFEALKKLPAADVVERKTGKWIEHNDDFGLTYECSVCHIEGMIKGKYCYNCGADMRGGKLMYDELIKNLRICSRCDFGQDCNGCTQKTDDAFCCDKLLHQAADAIEELTRENESLAKSVNEASDILRRRWIPVTERLPEKAEEGE